MYIDKQTALYCIRIREDSGNQMARDLNTLSELHHFERDFDKATAMRLEYIARNNIMHLPMGHDRPIILTDVWRTCNKLRGALFRIKGFNLRARLAAYDAEAKTKTGGGLITLDKFKTVLLGPVRNIVALSEQEVADLAEYFCVADGRIHYSQMCDVLELHESDFSKNQDLVSGLEWEDPLRVNRIADCEQRRLCQLIVKIAMQVKLRDICLRAHFQDYEVVAQDSGATTLDHFSRVLHRCGLTLSDNDHLLLIKRFQRDRFTINHVAFCKAVDEIVSYLDYTGLEQFGDELNHLFPMKLINAELPKTQRPEIGRVRVDDVLEIPPVAFHTIVNQPRQTEDLMTIMRRVQRHVFSNSIRCSHFFDAADPLHTGKVSVTKFRSILDMIGVSALHRLHLNEDEIDCICKYYRDPNDYRSVCWQTFDNDVSLGFTVKGLERLPDQVIESPPREIMEIPQQGAVSWDDVPEHRKLLCEKAVAQIRSTVANRGLDLYKLFKEYDPVSTGHVGRACMRRVLLSFTRIDGLSLRCIEDRYLDDRGFNYRLFLTEGQPQDIVEPLYKKFYEEMRELNDTPRLIDQPKACERDLPVVIAKIKSMVVSRRISVLEFMKEYDKTREGCVSAFNFRRCLNMSGLDLTNTEHETIAKAFASPKRPGFIDHVRFGECIEQAFVQLSLERSPLTVPIQYVPAPHIGCRTGCVLNRDERRLARRALELLSKKPDRVLNYESVFEDFDSARCGTVSQHQFMRAMSLRGSYHLLTPKEWDVVMKCFYVERGYRKEVDYRAFLRCLDVTNSTLPQYPF
ncbi:uncharacterized protein LOC113381611 [Ctenocephalides felis]|uniref:uncharacterized protein LOC113381611 n=1 Tax=Ctenocephalides felis TaxID=7515 RepID=UPI000E6E39C5|nr:uncharacterized protein LOC113381611 [Ctenocephalides felis]